MSGPESPFPRGPEDPDHVRRLRDEARRRLEREEPPAPITIYGGPPLDGGGRSQRPEPAAVYGGPPAGGGGRVTRRWTLIGLILVLVGGIGMIVAWLLGRRNTTPPAAVYGGPPPPAQPQK